MEILKNVSEWEKRWESMKENGCPRNILLLTMSALKDTVNLSTYKYEYECADRRTKKTATKTAEVKGYGQLEAVPKMLLQLGKNADKENIVQPQLKKGSLLIIVLASEETQEQKESCILLDDSGKNDITWESQSAVQFFEDQIKDFSKDKSKVDFLGIDIGREIGFEETINGLRIATNIIRDICKYNSTRPEEPGERQKGLQSLEDMSRTNLYMDIHGGPRDSQMLVDAIITMLHMDKIMLSDAYTVRYNDDTKGDNEPNTNRIVSVKSTLGILDFASGMNEFINHGYAGSLIKYKEKMSRNGSLGTLIDEIENTSRAFSLSRINENSFAKLRNLLYPDPPAPGEPAQNADRDVLFQIFRESIGKDYGAVLGVETERTLFDEVKWALRKGFYQQCLAMIDARTPDYICKYLINWDTVSLALWDKEQNRVGEYKNRENLRDYRAYKEEDAKRTFIRIVAGGDAEPRNEWNIGLRTNHRKNRETNQWDNLYIEFGLWENGLWNDIKKFIQLWDKIRKERNKVIHVDPNDQRTPQMIIENIEDKVNEYLDYKERLA